MVVSLRKNNMRGLYAETGQSAKALEYINMLSPMQCCRESILANGIGDGKTVVYLQELIDKYADFIGLAIQALVLDEEQANDSAAWDKKVQMLDIACQLYSLIYGENLMSYHERLARFQWLISTYRIAQGNFEETIVALEEMAKHAIAYDKHRSEEYDKKYISAITDQLRGKAAIEKTQVHNCSYYMINYLDDKRYDGIRNDNRFISIVNELIAMAE